MSGRRRVRVSLYVRDSVLPYLHTAAVRKGLSVSAYVRYCLLDAMTRDLQGVDVWAMQKDVLEGQSEMLRDVE